MNESIQHSKVEVNPLPQPIGDGDSFVMLGSCFALYMAERLKQDGREVMVNPLGTLFNPFSIALTVEAALHAESVELPIFAADGQWRCWWANTRVMAPTREELDSIVRERLCRLRAALLSAQHLIVTLGTNVCYCLKEEYRELNRCQAMSPMVVTNCQRQPDRLFTEWRAGVGEVTDCLNEMVEHLLGVNPQLQIIFTVSPYRYKKYGYHGSQLSKATLLLAEDAVIGRYVQNCCYFPAYEIMLDELRDYDYYAPDGLHPASKAVDHILGRALQ